jgi:hypothetical protein
MRSQRVARGEIRAYDAEVKDVHGILALAISKPGRIAGANAAAAATSGP